MVNNDCAVVACYGGRCCQCAVSRDENNQFRLSEDTPLGFSFSIRKLAIIVLVLWIASHSLLAQQFLKRALAKLLFFATKPFSPNARGYIF